MNLRTAILLYALVLTVLFADVLFLGYTLDPSRFVATRLEKEHFEGQKGPAFCNDSGAVNWAFQPWKRFAHRQIRELEIPLWNPHQGLGVPLAANFQSGVFFPIQWLSYLFPFESAWDFLSILRLLLAGVFTYLFLCRLKFPSSAAWLGGLVFMLNGYFIDYVNMDHLNVETLIPAAFFSIEVWIQQPRGRNLILLVGVLCLTILAGMPESTLLLWIVLFCYLTIRIRQLPHNGRLWITSAGAFLLAATWSGILLIPSLEYLTLAYSKHYVFPYGLQSFPLKTMIGLIVPYFFGPPGALGWDASIDKAFNVPSAIGAAPLILAVIGCWTGKHPLKIFFAGLGLLSALKSFGFLPLQIIGYLPLLKLVVYTKYLQPFLCFSVAILCALGWNSVRLTQVRLYFQLGLPTALLAYAVVSAFWFAEQIIEQSHDRVAYGIAASVSLAVVSLLVFGILTILNSKNTRLASNGFYALVLVEVLLLSFRIHPEAAPKDTEESAEGFLRSTSSDYRLLSSPALPPNLATEFSLYDLGVLDPLLPSRYVSIMSAISDQPIRSRLSTEEIINLEHPFLDLASVRTIFHRKDIRNLLLRSAPSGENLPMMTVPGFDYETKSTPSGFSRSYNLWIPVENPELVLFITSTKEVSLRLTADNTALLSLNLKAGESLLKTIDLQQWKGQQTQIELHCISQSPLTTALIPLSGGKPTLELVETNPVSGLKVFKRPGALPMVRLTHKLECTSPGSSLEALERGLVTKDLSVTEECEGVYQLASGSSSEGSAKIIRRTGNTLTVQVAAANESMLFISQNYYPGWKAKVNGVQAKVHRLDYTFTGVVVPKGLSLIELRYRPMSFKLGLLVSLFGIITTLGLAKYFALGKITDQTQLFERNRPNI